MGDQHVNCGFSVLLDNSSVEFRLLGNRVAGAKSLTSFARTPDCCAVLMGRLYYRDEFLTNLLLKGDCEAATNDAALALAAYEKRGIHAISQLEGDYCVVIWDARSRMLSASRDPMGGYPIYWTCSGGKFIATTAIASLEPRAPASLDLDFVAEYLSLPFLATQDHLTQATIYKGIHRVMPGRILSVRLPDLKIDIQSVWRWCDKIVDPGTDRTEDIAEQFEPLVRNAVRERMSGRTAVHFSGGMDSTAVALVANEWIGRGVGHAPLHALSLVYKRLASLKGETAFIDFALAGHTNIISHRIEADDLLPYDSLRDEALSDEPYAVILCRAQDHAISEVAIANKIDTILTGCGGDDVFDAAPYHIAELLRSGRFGRAWREAIAWGSVFGRDPWAVLQPFGLKPLLPASLQAGLRSFLRRGQVGWRDQAAGTIAPWIMPSFARSYHLYERGLRQIQRSLFW